MTMKIICAWCGQDMGTKDGQGVEGDSHGICDDCLEAQLALLDGGRFVLCPPVLMGHVQDGAAPPRLEAGTKKEIDDGNLHPVRGPHPPGRSPVLRQDSHRDVSEPDVRRLL